jgi:hypothetical protein
MRNASNTERTATMDQFEHPSQPSLKDASRGVSADMSPEAIARRFAIAHELNQLCAWLGTAKPLGPVGGSGETPVTQAPSSHTDQ